jgi:hypothetical protein
MLIKNVINEIAVASSQNDGWEMLVYKMMAGKNASLHNSGAKC